LFYSSFGIRLLRRRKQFWIYEFDSTALQCPDQPTAMHNCIVFNLCNRSSRYHGSLHQLYFSVAPVLGMLLVSLTRSNTSRAMRHKGIYSRTETVYTSKKISGNMGSYSSILNEDKRTFMELSEYFVTGGRPDIQTALPRLLVVQGLQRCQELPNFENAHAVLKESFESNIFHLRKT
jgi:hypothetical protein